MILLWAVVLLPAALAVAALALPRARLVLGLVVVGALAEAGLVAALLPDGFRGRVFAADGHLFVDALGAFNLAIVAAVVAFSSLYAWSYYAPRLRSGRFSDGTARRFGAAWFAFVGSMVLVLVTNNLGLMWVGMEATTLASVLLVCVEFERDAVRASWTYLILCSVGIALALLGTFVFFAEARAVAGPGRSPFLWTDLGDLAPAMRPAAARLAFLFLLVGYGTKAGLAPMHTWLPEAHGQAPAPVSAVLSGVLLNCALYAIGRFLPLVDAATGGEGWPYHLLLPFGLISVGVAAAFIIRERDLKRLLAYCSVEHMGIIALGLGVGGAAAALYHTLNHSLGKMLTFFCAGDVVERYGSHDMRRMGGLLRVAPVAGMGLTLGLLALVGAPPFGVFMSELWIVRRGLDGGHGAAVIAFLVGAAVTFIAVIKHVVDVVWRPRDEATPLRDEAPRTRLLLVALPLLALLAVGIWMPPQLRAALDGAAAIVGGHR